MTVYRWRSKVWFILRAVPSGDARTYDHMHQLNVHRRMALYVDTGNCRC